MNIELIAADLAQRITNAPRESVLNWEAVITNMLREAESRDLPGVGTAYRDLLKEAHQECDRLKVQLTEIKSELALSTRSDDEKPIVTIRRLSADLSAAKDGLSILGLRLTEAQVSCAEMRNALSTAPVGYCDSQAVYNWFSVRDYALSSDCGKALAERIQRYEQALRAIHDYPVHSEPVGGAMAMQDLAHEALKPGSEGGGAK